MNPLKKRQYKRIFTSRWLALFLFVVMLFLARGAWNVYEKSSIANRELERSRERYEELLARAQKIESDLSELESREGGERVLRERYGVAREGEQVIVLVHPEDDEGREPSSSRESDPSLWERLLNLFK